MSFLADLHIHSYYSRATSRMCCLEGFQEWAQRKGVAVVGTGDFSHPKWREELRDKLEPGRPGLFRLKREFADPANQRVPAACRGDVHFMLTAEISSIYKRDGRVRKVHSLLLAPGFEAADRIASRLERIGNVASDGRPILGLDARDLLEIVLEADPRAVLIPAHIWTPWFSMLGSKSGFDDATECFADLVEHVFAVETGLSSDPPMNWRVPSLDRFVLISNSDLHSAPNLGRDATVFHCEADYFRMIAALRDKDRDAFGGTLDLFPEEGKYHLDGHRKCTVAFEPRQSLERDGLCPACGKGLTLGVLHRVEALAGRPEGHRPESAFPCRHIIPLPTLLSELTGRGPATKTVQKLYDTCLEALGPELDILLDRDLADVESHGPPLLAEALRRLRAGSVIRQAGFDGQYGVVRVFDLHELPPRRPARSAPRARTTGDSS